ncbi:MAG: TonB-dependent receptor [Ferruginibacter sp.]|nr:TonB-dependent receptor [Ferruginibacter sp.]
MKPVLCFVLLLCFLGGAAQEKNQFNDTFFLQPIEVTAIRAGDKAPFAKTNLTRKDIAKNNLGQDLPYLLNQTPSVVINSDAGNGVGYTGIRIRGSDATRINVTLNGIPYNDAESQGSFFVNIPDFASSANSIQVQRGIGTSSNGAGAFGATLNLSTNEVTDSFYTELNNSYGSFNTWKNTLRVGSGIIANHFTIDARLSRIGSDGFVDRAASNLKSGYLSLAYLNDKNSLRFNIFSGKEKTYQSWNGIPQSMLNTDRTFNSAGTERPGTPYDNETDNYTQTHFQLFYNHQFNKYWKANIAGFLTKGAGYYEQYKAGESFSDYGLPDYDDGGTVITETDLVRRLWLDNKFYGTIFSLQHQKNSTQLTFGGSWNQYDGQHFGEIKWATVANSIPANYRWYDLPATKKDLSVYTKWSQQITSRLQSFVDLQYRNVQYDLAGFRDNPALMVNKSYSFFNPKFGLTYSNNGWQAFLSYALGAKEPNRDDFEAGATLQPKPEKLQDLELGIEKKTARFSYGLTGYYMRYKDQLVLTGQINDVGAYTRTNIKDSYRAGVELQGTATINKCFKIAANLALSENKTNNFTEYIDDYDNGGQLTKQYGKPDIAFSPAVVGGATLSVAPFRNAEISFLSKYVGRQYLDNTSQKSRSLDPYFVQDLRLSYSVAPKYFKAIDFILQLNNVFDNQYEANGYTFSYVYGGMTTENYYFPMAPFNIMAGVNIRF